MDRTTTSRISFRLAPRGGAIKEVLSDAEKQALKSRQQLVLLIHGYNNDQKDAVEAYNGFRNMQRILANLDPDEPVFEDRIVEVFWPGDADWGKLSALYYMRSIDQAKKTAWLLADALEEAGRSSGTRFVDIVAHSMGCRLTLELLKNLTKNSPVFVRRVVFMAGAVPVFMLDPTVPGGKLRPGYDEHLGDKALSLYSQDDRVLSVAFPVGQTLAGTGEGFWPTALGHEKWVHEAVPGNLAQKKNVSAGHSDYWGWNPGSWGNGLFANREVSNFLQIGRAGDRVEEQRDVFARQTAQSRRIEERQVETDSDLLFG